MPPSAPTPAPPVHATDACMHLGRKEVKEQMCSRSCDRDRMKTGKRLGGGCLTPWGCLGPGIGHAILGYMLWVTKDPSTGHLSHIFQDATALTHCCPPWYSGRRASDRLWEWKRRLIKETQWLCYKRNQLEFEKTELVQVRYSNDVTSPLLVKFY